MGIKVWLDDSRPAPDGWKHATNVEQAQTNLLRGNVDEMSLDHDLDNPVCANCDFKCGHRDGGQCANNCACHSNGDRTGLDLLNWMVYWHIWPKKKPVVHSTAGQHAEEMKDIIEKNFPR